MRSPGPVVWGAAFALVVLVLIPLSFIVLQAIFPALGQGSLSAPFTRVADVLTEPGLLRMTRNTALLGLGVVAGSAVIAVPLGVLRALFRVPLAPLWDILLLVPFMIPPYIATLGWIMTLQPNGYLTQLTGLNAGPYLFSLWGVVFVMTLGAFPVVYFAVSRTVEAIGGRYADVGRVFGASPFTAFRRVTLPLALPGLMASLLLVFAMTIEEYGTPAALGRQSGFEVLVTGIDTRVSDWPIDLPGAAILSLILVMMSLGAFLVQLRILSRRSFETVGGKPQAFHKRPLGVFAIPVVAVFALVSLLAVGVPLFAIFATALSKTLSGGLAADNIGFGHFRAIAADENGAFQALLNSLGLGAATALITGLIGAATSYAVVRTQFRGKGFLDALTVIPNAIPGIVVAVGIILAWNQPWLPVTPYNTPLILLMAYCCILLPYTVRYANAAFRQVGDNLEAAARVAGATPLTAFRRILLPLVLPSLISAMLLVFAVATRELVASILLAPVGMATISIFIWRQFDQGSVGLGMAMSAVTILITTTIPLAVTLMSGRRGLM
ncbi:iron(III) transport system permease protein [Pseudochelatococcus lubricantis]|uniref:Iron(III) transport system permease protein n=1 Tax=Pseudochelatococcus lubricantis TaxID=1538102 RepID=A0ABX0V2S9_9HYPH|nr:iron ABC transporter permease [Pseudochelatococcus lubricantis]NIJ59524.1 iron(III) transport system permease protein [Pseudochelatococcus lubricantis]